MMRAVCDRTYRHRVSLSVTLALMLALSITSAQAQEYVARPGDILDVLVVGEPEFSHMVTVTLDGNLFLPLVGNVNVAGLTLKQIEKKLTETLARFIREPKVMLTFREGSQQQVVFALGQAARPGSYPYRWGTTVAKLLAECGGPGPHAALHRALILQRTEATPVDLDRLLKGDTSQNHPLQPGDVLLIPEITDRVLVLGEVARPGYEDLKDNMRLLDAITEAGGPTLKAAPERITIMREGQMVKSDLEAFLRRGDVELNVPVRSGDVVYVPETDRRILVMGEVAHPGPLPVTPEFPKRAMDAVLAAGGPTKGANLSSVTVIRQGGEKSTEIKVNLDKFINNAALDQNIPVQPGDVIYVPPGAGQTFANFIELLSGIEVLRLLLGIL